MLSTLPESTDRAKEPLQTLPEASGQASDPSAALALTSTEGNLRFTLGRIL